MVSRRGITTENHARNARITLGVCSQLTTTMCHHQPYHSEPCHKIPPCTIVSTWPNKSAVESLFYAMYNLPFLQVHYPSDPLQPGPVYFLTPRKCAVFGVTCEGLPRQVIFCNAVEPLCKGALEHNALSQ